MWEREFVIRAASSCLGGPLVLAVEVALLYRYNLREEHTGRIEAQCCQEAGSVLDLLRLALCVDGNRSITTRSGVHLGVRIDLLDETTGTVTFLRATRVKPRPSGARLR